MGPKLIARDFFVDWMSDNSYLSRKHFCGSKEKDKSVGKIIVGNLSRNRSEATNLEVESTGCFGMRLMEIFAMVSSNF